MFSRFIMSFKDESPTMDLESVHRRPCPALRPGQEETCKVLFVLSSIYLVHGRGTQRTMNISKQLQVLQLEPFIGRPHSGIDVGFPPFLLGLD